MLYIFIAGAVRFNEDVSPRIRHMILILQVNKHIYLIPLKNIISFGFVSRISACRIKKETNLERLHLTFQTLMYVSKMLKKKQKKKKIFYISDIMKSSGFEPWTFRFQSGNVAD